MRHFTHSMPTERWARREFVFEHACQMGLEGIVSERLSAPYRSGRSRDWIKVKNPDSPAMVRARERRSIGRVFFSCFLCSSTGGPADPSPGG
jgi:ATP-dependent DNA ligase